MKSRREQILFTRKTFSFFIMLKNLLRGYTIAVTGDFGLARPHEKMKQWIQAHGGTFMSQIDRRTTHLVCSKAHFKMSVATGTVHGPQIAYRTVILTDVMTVRDALAIKTVKIVTYDWLEDCLMRSRRLSEKEYLMPSKISKDLKTKKKVKRVENIRKGSRFRIYSENAEQ